MTRAWVGALTAAMCFACWLIGACATADAATGDLLRSITAANPQSCGVNVGLAFDGQNLLISCVEGDGSGSAKIDYINPSDGSLVRTLAVPGHKGLAAMAYDAGRNRIWACDNPSGVNDTGAGVDVYLINPANGSSTKQFTTAGCWDGLAYDAADDTVYAGPDQSDTVYHYSSSGKLLGQFSGLTAKLGGSGKSGIAVGGSSLFISNDGGSQIYSAPKDLGSTKLLATEPGEHLEDMECDSVTFAPKDAMWVVTAFDRTVHAYEIPRGTCGVGGRASNSPPPPVLGKSFGAVLVSGTVLVRLPNHGPGLVRLAPAQSLPTGTQVDARRGTMKLVAATPHSTKTQSGSFRGAVFNVAQNTHGAGITTLSLLEGLFGTPSFAGCNGSSRRVLQTLHASDRGHFRSRGHYAAATVRGTVWDTTDRCDGTLVVVHRGTVAVSDFVRHVTVIVRAGHRYLAKAPRRR